MSERTTDYGLFFCRPLHGLYEIANPSTQSSASLHRGLYASACSTGLLQCFRLGVDQDLETTVDHALDVEGHRPFHLRNARVLHYLCVDAIAMRS